MVRRVFNPRTVLSRLSTCLLLLAAAIPGAGLAGLAAGAASPVEPRVWFSESHRRERLTTRSFSSTKTDTAWQTRLHFDAVLPLAGAGTVTAETPVLIHAGAFQFTGKLSNDPDYAPDKRRLRLSGIDVTSSGASVRRPPTLEVEWDAQRVRLRVDGPIGEAGSAVAEDLSRRSASDVEGKLPVSIRFGEAAAQTYVPFRGRVKSKRVTNGDDDAEVITVEVRATGKRP